MLANQARSQFSGTTFTVQPSHHVPGVAYALVEDSAPGSVYHAIECSPGFVFLLELCVIGAESAQPVVAQLELPLGRDRLPLRPSLISFACALAASRGGVAAMDSDICQTASDSPTETGISTD